MRLTQYFSYDYIDVSRVGMGNEVMLGSEVGLTQMLEQLLQYFVE